jgi:hypothetical protein
MIDYWQLCDGFKAGDTVQKYMPGDPGGLSPFVGRVTAVHKGLGMVDVQWPSGNERVLPDELVVVNPALMRYLPPSLDQTYLGYDTLKERSASEAKSWRSLELPQGFHKDLARMWLRKASEVLAYDELWRRYASQGASDGAIKDEVGKFYLVAKNLIDLRIQQHAAKTSAYWVAQNRQYRVTQGELDGRKPNCPRCGTKMRKTTYAMSEGARHQLWACPKDLFLIHQQHMMGPGGEPVAW